MNGLPELETGQNGEELPFNITEKCYRPRGEGERLKQQIGVRVDSKLWSQFKTLCSQAHLRPSEAIEAFLKICLAQKSISTILNKLEALNIGETTAHEITLQKLLIELDAYFQYDFKRGEGENYSNVKGCIEDIAKVLPKIVDQKLISEAEAKISGILTYYRKIFEKAETPPEDIIIFHIKTR